MSDPVQISQIRHGKSSISQPFSVTNLGNPDLIMSNLVLFCKFVTGRREGKEREEAQNIILCVILIPD